MEAKTIHDRLKDPALLDKALAKSGSKSAPAT